MSKVKKFSTVFALVIMLILGSFALVACCGEQNITFTISETLKSEAENVLEIMENNVLNKLPAKEGESTYSYYTYEEAKEAIPEFTEYYVLVGTVNNVTDLESVGFGDVVYDKDQTIPLSVGMTHFIKDKIYYFEDNKLYMAAPILLLESAGETKIKLNGQEVDFNMFPAAEEISFTDIKFCFDTTNEVDFNEDTNEYTLIYNEGAQKSMVGCYYDGMAQNDISINSLYKNGKLDSYSVTTNTDKDKDGNYPLTYYFVSYKEDVNDINESYDGAKFELKSYIYGKGFATATFINQINYTEEIA